MFQRRTSGSVVCPSCGSLVGVRDEKCYTCGRANPGLWGFGPALRNLSLNLGFSQLVVGACVTLWLVTLLMSNGIGGAGNILNALSPDPRALFLFGVTGPRIVFDAGRWWTLLSAGWLHFGLLHVAMNMYWVWQMGPWITDLFGPARTVIIYTIGGVAGFALSVIVGHYFPFLPLAPLGLTAGASAPVFGLIGALYHYGRTGSSAVKQVAVSIIIQAVIFGIVMVGSINNYAHLGGFIGGYVMSAWLNPMKPERGDHMIIALICLVATGVSIVASIVTGLAFLQ
jgi:rhomboid protease GluP